MEEFTAVGEEGVIEGGGEDSFRRKHGNKCAKPMKVEGGEDVPGEFCQVHSKRDVQILEGSFERVKVSLGTSDPMKEANEFMGNRVFMEKGDLFDGMEDNRGFEDGGIEQVNSMYGQERRVKKRLSTRSDTIT